MKKLLLILLLLPMIGFGQNSKIIGEWHNAEKDAIITLFTDKQEANTISGKITWMKEPLDKNGNPKTDPLNPDKKLQKRKRMGMKIMYDFKFKGDGLWEEGRVYDPKKGKTYGGKMTLIGKNKLKLKGYLLGFPLIGRSSIWTRKNKI